MQKWTSEVLSAGRHIGTAVVRIEKVARVPERKSDGPHTRHFSDNYCPFPPLPPPPRRNVFYAPARSYTHASTSVLVTVVQELFDRRVLFILLRPPPAFSFPSVSLSPPATSGGRNGERDGGEGKKGMIKGRRESGQRKEERDARGKGEGKRRVRKIKRLRVSPLRAGTNRVSYPT